MHNTPSINARPAVNVRTEVPMGEPSASCVRPPSSPPALSSGSCTLTDSTAISGKGLSDLPAEVMLKIAGYLPRNDLENMRLATSQLKDVAERNMSLLINGREELQNLVGSNFHHPKQVTLIGAYEADDSDNLRTAVKAKIVDLGRTPEESAAAYYVRLTGAGINTDHAAKAAVPAVPRRTGEPGWSHFGRLFETGMSARDAATIATIDVPEPDEGTIPFQQAHFYVGRGFDIPEAADLAGHRGDHEFYGRLLGAANNYGAHMARMYETQSWTRLHDQN
jgi:hypothetical protein